MSLPKAKQANNRRQTDNHEEEFRWMKDKKKKKKKRQRRTTKAWNVEKTVRARKEGQDWHAHARHCAVLVNCWSLAQGEVTSCCMRMRMCAGSQPPLQCFGQLSTSSRATCVDGASWTGWSNLRWWWKRTRPQHSCSPSALLPQCACSRTFRSPKQLVEGQHFARQEPAAERTPSSSSSIDKRFHNKVAENCQSAVDLLALAWNQASLVLSASFIAARSSLLVRVLSSPHVHGRYA